MDFFGSYKYFLVELVIKHPCALCLRNFRRVPPVRPSGMIGTSFRVTLRNIDQHSELKWDLWRQNVSNCKRQGYNRLIRKFEASSGSNDRWRCHLNFSVHVSNVCMKTSQRIGVIMRLRNLTPTVAKLHLSSSSYMLPTSVAFLQSLGHL